MNDPQIKKASVTVRASCTDGYLGAVDELGRLIALYYNDGAAAIAAVTDAVGRVDEWRKGRREPQP